MAVSVGVRLEMGCYWPVEGSAAADGEDRGSVAAEAAVEETLLQGEAGRRLDL
jgi:hypothetical protein